MVFKSVTDDLEIIRSGDKDCLTGEFANLQYWQFLNKFEAYNQLLITKLIFYLLS